MAEHDSGYKLLFSFPEMMGDLLQEFIPEPWVGDVDLATLEKVSGSYVSDDLRDREDDIIWRVRWKDEWLYVYLLLEFQSTVDPAMALRIMGYVALLYLDLLRTGAASLDTGLPPVVPIVLYNGQRPWTAAEDVAELVAPARKGVERYRPHQRYLLLDENRYSDEELRPLRNLVAAVFRLEKSRTKESTLEVVTALLEWLRAPEEAGLRRAFAVWIRRVLLPSRLPGVELPPMEDLTEVKRMLEEQSIDWTRPIREEAQRAGMLEGEAAVVTRLLEKRFGPLAESVREQIAAADAETLLEWAERVLTARRLEDVVG